MSSPEVIYAWRWLIRDTFRQSMGELCVLGHAGRQRRGDLLLPERKHRGRRSAAAGRRSRSAAGPTVTCRWPLAPGASRCSATVRRRFISCSCCWRSGSPAAAARCWPWCGRRGSCRSFFSPPMPRYSCPSQFRAGSCSWASIWASWPSPAFRSPSSSSAPGSLLA